MAKSILLSVDVSKVLLYDWLGSFYYMMMCLKYWLDDWQSQFYYLLICLKYCLIFGKVHFTIRSCL